MLDEVLFSQEGQLGVITLNRPGALNALTLPMILAMQRQLELWREDNAVLAVVIHAVPGNAFCAGGDVRWLYQTGQHHLSEQLDFFWHEYRLNHFIHHFGKPYIALMDGITMGGGVGVSLHGSHPIASECFVFAMPETSIGFFPDIGASYLLTRCADSLGIYLGLTGSRLGASDAKKAGLVKQVVSSEQMPHLLRALMKEDLTDDPHAKVEQCIQTYAEKFRTLEELGQIKPLIQPCFSQPTIEMIRASLQEQGDAWTEAMSNLLAQKSPLSLKVTLAQLQKAKELSLAECLSMDFDLVQHFMRDKDFYEGVRALLIDKDKNPQWNPRYLDLVTEHMVDKYFERGQKKLEFVC